MDAMKLAVARTFAWALLLSGWLVLGSLGQLHLPLFAHGLFPVTLWLATAGIMFHVGQGVLVSGRVLRLFIAALGVLVGACLLWATRGGGALAVCAAAVGWGVLLVAASRAVRLMRADRRPPPPVASAAVGALLAWAWFGEPMASPSWATAAVLPCIALALGWMLPREAAARGCRTGLFDCALPMTAQLPWRDPSAWGTHCARWTMLPMMATLVVMAQWCGGDAGITATQWVGLHLAAMLLPPLALMSLPRSPRVQAWSRAWPTAAMAIGLVLLVAMPGLRGLMAMSLCHSVAWGLAWFAVMSRPPAMRRAAPISTAPTRLTAALYPAFAVLGIGLALGDFGPAALEAVQAGLGLVATVGAIFAWWRTAPWILENRP
jgi:hypothetical protein